MATQGEVRLTLPLLQAREDTLTVVKDDQQRGQEVTHALDIADLDVLPDVAAGEMGRNEWAAPRIPTQPALSWPASLPTPRCSLPSGPPPLSSP